MISCPRKNLKIWKDLVKIHGENNSYSIWNYYEGNVPEKYYQESSNSKIPINENTVNFKLKSVDILLKLSDKQQQIWKSWQNGKLTNEQLLERLQIPKEQKQIVLDNLDIELSPDEVALDIVSKYGYTVEINIATSNLRKEGKLGAYDNFKFNDDIYHFNPILNYYRKNYIDISKKEYEDAWKEFDNTDFNTNTQYYSNLTVSGGTNYTENEISTPLITPSIKGHAQFSTDNGIGWFRSDDRQKQTNTGLDADNRYNELFDKIYLYREVLTKYEEEELNVLEEGVRNQYVIDTKTRRILEVQSDLFQKGRDKQSLAGYKSDLSSEEEQSYNRYLLETGQITQEEFNNPKINGKDKENQFLQLLNKDNNWVTFFVKSIIQDSIKKGYEKVLFPTGNTASKVEGHTTLEEFKKQKEDRLKFLKTLEGNIEEGYEWELTPKDVEREINQIKQELERVETEGFGALKPIYNFYENTITNILKKQGYNPTLITDEYGNTWNEVNISKYSNNYNKITGEYDPNSTSKYLEEIINNSIQNLTNKLEQFNKDNFKNDPFTCNFI